MNTAYDYVYHVTKDVLTWIQENGLPEECRADRDAAEEYLDDVLWAEDSVTGNASGSYWGNPWEAEEALCHNLEWLHLATVSFCAPVDLRDPEEMDVTIRCYLLGDAIYKALNTLEEQGYFTSPEDQEVIEGYPAY